MAQRVKLVRRIGEFKWKQNVTILQLSRWEKIRASRITLAKGLGLDTNFVKKILQLVHKESIHQQTEVMKYLSNKDKEN